MKGQSSDLSDSTNMRVPWMSFEIIDRDLYGLSLQNSLKSLLHQSCVKGICMTELRASREVVKHTHTPHTHTHIPHLDDQSCILLHQRTLSVPPWGSYRRSPDWPLPPASGGSPGLSDQAAPWSSDTQRSKRGGREGGSIMLISIDNRVRLWINS